MSQSPQSPMTPSTGQTPQSQVPPQQPSQSMPPGFNPDGSVIQRGATPGYSGPGSYQYQNGRLLNPQGGQMNAWGDNPAQGGPGIGAQVGAGNGGFGAPQSPPMQQQQWQQQMQQFIPMLMQLMGQRQGQQGQNQWRMQPIVSPHAGTTGMTGNPALAQATPSQPSVASTVPQGFNPALFRAGQGY